jgi:hypothetical protein
LLSIDSSIIDLYKCVNVVRVYTAELLSACGVTYYNLSIYILNYPVISPAATPPPQTSVGDYGVGLEQLASMSKDQNVSALQQYGGVSRQHTLVLLTQMLQ